MRYIKVETILPDDLVREIQKYVQGKYIYIPTELEKRKKWGENSGNRIYIQNRNKSIYSKYVNGYKIKDLAEEFFLSVDSIKKIVYGKNR